MPENRSPRFNASGCSDPTAYSAVKNISREDSERERAISDFLRTTKGMARCLGLEILNRIVLKDTKTGKEYR